MTITLTAVHRVSVARAVLEGISHYVQHHEGVEAAVGGGSVARVTYPVPAKNQAETKLWHNADCFLDSVAGLIHDEGMCRRVVLSHLAAGMRYRVVFAHLAEGVYNRVVWAHFAEGVFYRVVLTHLAEGVCCRVDDLTLSC